MGGPAAPVEPARFAFPFTRANEAAGAIDDLLVAVQRWHNDLEAVGVASGPESFRGAFAHRFRHELAAAGDDLALVRARLEALGGELAADLAVAGRAVADHEEAWRRHRLAIAAWNDRGGGDGP